MATATHLSTDGPTAGNDLDMDDLLNYDAVLGDPFGERALEAKRLADREDAGKKRKNGAGLGLGLDAEVEVTRKPREARVKLDEERLLSRKGIPELRKRAKKLTFKGRGHEYQDIATLLTLYQLWLDDLFPKAKFRDCLAMVEKLGHKKRIQMARQEWIDEGRPKPVRNDVHGIFHEPTLPSREKDVEMVAPLTTQKERERPRTPGAKNGDADVGPDEEMEDLYGASPVVARRKSATATPFNREDSLFEGEESSFDHVIRRGVDGAANEEIPDDLDAILAETEMSGALPPVSTIRNATEPARQEDDFDDELEALAAMGML